MNEMKQKEERRSLGRRSLIKWSLAAGAALGLPQWKVFEVLEMTGGKALAEEASCAISNRSVHIVAGSGGFAWFQLIWPHNDIAAARNDNFAWHAIGMERMAEGTHRPLTLGPESPWQTAPGRLQVTALMAGVNQTHTRTPDSNMSLAMNTGLLGACAAIQTANPTLTPVIAIDDVPFLAANGAPRISRVGSAGDVVALFNSAASRAGGLLRERRSSELYSATYSAWMSLRAAAAQTTMRNGVQTGTTSARLLGTNLADALQITDADRMRYGIDGSSRRQNRELAESLIVTAKAFKHGLTSMVVIPAFRDDPHGAFGDMGSLQRTVQQLGRTLDAFYEDLAAVEDPTCQGQTLAGTTVMSVHGDTPKNPRERGGWPDGTPNDANWVYVRGAGHLKTGWFGGVTRSGVIGWNPTTGAESGDISSAATSNAAAAAVLYAVARGDNRRVQDFYRGADIGGIANNAIT